MILSDFQSLQNNAADVHVARSGAAAELRFKIVILDGHQPAVAVDHLW